MACALAKIGFFEAKFQSLEEQPERHDVALQREAEAEHLDMEVLESVVCDSNNKLVAVRADVGVVKGFPPGPV